MFAHLRANLWLLFLSVVICCVLYPAAVWVVGQTIFHNQAQGSLIDENGNPVSDPAQAKGSALIAQSFNSPWFFQSRPSAASYNAAASGGSNYGASNPKLRGRVTQQLGPIVRYSDAYKKAHPKSDGSEPNPQDDMKDWFKAQTDAKHNPFTDWATNNSTLAQAWATGAPEIKDYILQWAKDHPDVIADWKKDNATVTTDPGADALVSYFFKSYEKEFFGKWPTDEAAADVKTKIAAWAKDHPNVAKKWKEANPDAKDEPKDDDLVTFFFADYDKNPKDWPPLDGGEFVDGAASKVVKPDAQDSDVQSTFFDTWLAEQVKAKKLDPLKDFEQVPADMVTASGSGLDPDISLANAEYQRPTVVQGVVGKLASDYVARDENKGLTDEAKKKLQDSQTEKLTPQVDAAVGELLKQQAYRPMWGLTGDGQLVNVLRLNLAIKAKMDALALK